MSGLPVYGSSKGENSVLKHVVIIFTLLTQLLQVTYAEPVVCALIKEKYSTKNSMDATFEQSIYWHVREKNTKNSGRISVAPGEKFRVTLKNETYVSNGTVYWQYSKLNQQVVINNLASIDLSSHPSHLLSTFLTSYPFTEQKRLGDVITLEWRADSTAAADAAYQLITINARADGAVTFVKLVDKNDNVHTYRFENISFGVKFPAKTFEFEVPPHAAVIDNRG